MSNNKVKQMRVTEKEYAFIIKIRALDGYVLPKDDIISLMMGLDKAIDSAKEILKDLSPKHEDYEDLKAYWQDDILRYEWVKNSLLDRLHI